MIVVAANIEMNAAGDRDAVLFVRGADRRPVVRHVDDGVGRRNRSLDRVGCVGDGGRLGICFRMAFAFALAFAAAVVFAAVCFCSLSSFCSSSCNCFLSSAISASVPLADSARACEVINAPITPIAAAVVSVALDI